MGTIVPKDEGFTSDQPRFVEDDENLSSAEQIETWFLGSLIRDKQFPSLHFKRLANLHNRITHKETHYDERTQVNTRIASQLGEFFPLKWLTEITASFREMNASKLGIKSYEDRVGCYLGYIDLYLIFRGLTLLDSTLQEINTTLNISLTQSNVRSWKLKLIRLIPNVQESWVKIRKQNRQIAFVSTVIQVMNRELILQDYTGDEIFQIKSACIQYAKKFVQTNKARFVKKMEVWAQAICLKAIRIINHPSAPFPFPHLPDKTRKVLIQKRWQLDQLL
ncbi:MAG: hypothetical protein ACXAC8_16255 [Candidatus Hodarchaeales archaeon]|jgi:hypothetical protein